jgi:NAD(P)-dependent dehydrogenase (short-subunit alcohol dehydrogenase family)
MFDPEALKGRVALVTGSSRGLGAEIALTFGLQGAAVAVCGRVSADAEAVAARITAESGSPAKAYTCDLTKAAEVDALVTAIEADLGPVDVLVNNAGGYTRVQTTVDTSPSDWDSSIAINLTAAFLCMHAVLPGMITRGWGRIVNIGSEAGRTPSVLSTVAYSAAKAGLVGLTKHAARETADKGVTVNVVNPGAMMTERMIRRWANTPGGLARMLTTIPVGRAADLTEIAVLVAYLVGPYGGYATGATFDVNGGRVMF